MIVYSYLDGDIEPPRLPNIKVDGTLVNRIKVISNPRPGLQSAQQLKEEVIY
jgi:hypothetical protein